MEHVNAAAKLGDVDDPECTARIAYPDLAHSAAHGWHRFPVAWLESLLHPIKLVAGLTTSPDRERPQVIEGPANELDRPHSPQYTSTDMNLGMRSSIQCRDFARSHPKSHVFNLCSALIRTG